MYVCIVHTFWTNIYSHWATNTVPRFSLLCIKKERKCLDTRIAGNGVPEHASYILSSPFTSFHSFFHTVKFPVPLYDMSHFINCTFLGVGLARLINNKLSRHCMQCLCKFITAVIGIGLAFTVWPIFLWIKSWWSLQLSTLTLYALWTHTQTHKHTLHTNIKCKVHVCYWEANGSRDVCYSFVGTFWCVRIMQRQNYHCKHTNQCQAKNHWK